MDALIQWVMQIIIFLLLAAIVDLLIPSTVMKKYMKLAIGLVFILIFLKPVFHFFQMDIEHALQTSYEKVSEMSDDNNDMKNSINLQKKDIQASQDAYIVEQLTTDLKDMADEPLKEQYNMEIADIEYTFQDDNQPTYEGLEEIRVTIREQEVEKEAVDTVEEIEINTEQRQQTEEEESSEMNEAIESTLMDIWEITDKTVTVEREGGES